MTPNATTPSAPVADAGAAALLHRLVGRAHAAMARIPESAIALLGRFSLAAVFWKSGQTKIEGLSIDIVAGTFDFGWPRLASSAVDLFRDEYRLPLLPPEAAATMAAFGEHVLPLLLLLGLGTRFAALGLLAMTATIQFLVYPGAYPTHGVWAAVLLWLMARGPGVVSLDHWLARRQSPA
ncbi:MAG: DoxX family protein [Rubrivivax sp.]|nr:DoxX family protein [Rubrivivax sp.]